MMRLGLAAVFSVIALTLLAAYALTCSYIYVEPSLPSAATMKSIELQVPLRVYSRESKLIAQIGTERRSPVKYSEIPAVVRNAFIAAEDDRFFTHHGFDWQGIMRALLVNVASADFAQGASTITMQAARNLFLTQDRTIRRKLQEIFLTYRLEREFTKQEILGLYLNVIFFGQRSYGVAAAAETYFGKNLNELTLAEAATLARVPQSPSSFNPITNPQGAAERRAYVLRRMLELGLVDAAAAEAAGREPLRAKSHRPVAEVDAPYVAEMVRLEIIKRYGAAAQNAGYRVYTSIDGRLQTAANQALRNGLVEYDQRHGWRGATSKTDLSGNETAEQFDRLLEEYTTVGLLAPAVVVSVAEKSARVYLKERGFMQIDWPGMSWARKYETEMLLGPEPKTAGQILTRGDVIYTTFDDQGEKLRLAQVPEAEAALVAVNPNDGAIVSLVGGFDYFDKSLGKFNRVTQAKRQPGSGFKPFLYAAALANDFTASSIIVDAPVVVESSGEEADWRPENSGGTFGGPMRLREALVRSRNLVSIRILKELGLKAATDYATRFGFAREALPQNLTLALGTMQATPLEMATAYCVFANGGYRVEPYFIEKIEAPSGEVVYSAAPTVVCPGCPPGDARLKGGQPAERVISPQVAFLMGDIMADVVKRGTGRRALALGRGDIAGKTGTTNDSMDTWFNGFNSDLVATAWVGFDQTRSLGESEEGAKTAIPIWLDFMRVALQGVPERRRPVPDGIVQVMISPTTGGPATGEEPGLFEYFRADRLPSLGIMGGSDVPNNPFSGAPATVPADPRRPPPPTNDQIF
ncbi:MAG: penicillin-binding protein 1A [Steroidobacteraceae bacterium]|nr:penicillin-binding protein 1A [Steroidobacteraceae bacterium]